MGSKLVAAFLDFYGDFHSSNNHLESFFEKEFQVDNYDKIIYCMIYTLLARKEIYCTLCRLSLRPFSLAIRFWFRPCQWIRLVLALDLKGFEYVQMKFPCFERSSIMDVFLKDLWGFCHGRKDFRAYAQELADLDFVFFFEEIRLQLLTKFLFFVRLRMILILFLFLSPFRLSFSLKLIEEKLVLIKFFEELKVFRAGRVLIYFS